MYMCIYIIPMYMCTHYTPMYMCIYYILMYMCDKTGSDCEWRLKFSPRLVEVLLLKFA